MLMTGGWFMKFVENHQIQIQSDFCAELLIPAVL